MPDSVEHSCKLGDCSVATTGKCVEALDLSVCPNYVPEASDEGPELTEELNQNDEATGDPRVDIDTVNLPDGLDFDVVTGSLVTRAHLTRVIVVAGDKDCGKTTLVTSVYELFQLAPVAGYLFGGCRTFTGLERRCFSSRLASERSYADTIRTSRGDGQRFLHLKVRAEDLSRPPQDILFSDISGELFKDACNSTEECQQLQILKRADHIALCLDGKKLASAALRHEAFNTTSLFLQSALDAEMIGHKTFVDILVLKRDLLGTNDASSQALDYVGKLQEKISNGFKDEFGRLRFHEIAARPMVAGFPFGYGLEQVLPSWVEETPLYGQPPPFSLREAASSLAKTEFDRYVLKT